MPQFDYFRGVQFIASDKVEKAYLIYYRENSNMEYSKVFFLSEKVAREVAAALAFDACEVKIETIPIMDRKCG